MGRLGKDYYGMALTALIIMALMLPLMPIAVGESADYLDHIRDARLWAEAGISLQNANRPHFLFHLLTVGAHSLTEDWNRAASVVIILVSGMAGAFVFARLRPYLGEGARAAALTIVISVQLMLIASITIFTWGEQNLYFGYIPAHVYHNPTQQVLKPFALLFFVAALWAFTPTPTSRNTHIQRIVLTFAAGLCATLAKPSFSICLLPALGAWVVYRLYRRQSIDWLLLIFGVGAPVALVLGWQYLFHRSGMGGFALDPLLVVNSLSPGSWHWKLLMSLLFPLAVYLLYWRSAITSIPLNLAWLAFGASAVYLYLLSEPRDWPSANFWWSAQICMFILMIETTRFFIEQWRNRSMWTIAQGACLVLFILHTASGILWYVVQFDGAGFYVWW